MQPILDVVEHAKQLFHRRLTTLSKQGGLTEELYVRYLSMQYHLTRGVQRHFLQLAAHPSLADKRPLRDFLYRFGLEEEPHYKLAEIDLQNLGHKPLPCPLDVSLWWAYFDRIVLTRPLVRLGATCILENLGAGAGDLGHALLDGAAFLKPESMHFLTIHFHEILPHGDQILQAITSVELSKSQVADLVEGANVGAIFYLRFVDWALKTAELTVTEFNANSTMPQDLPEGNYLDIPELLKLSGGQ